MRTVHEVSQLTGVSVRTLHHYDAIGLLKPTEVTGAGYRLYDDTALERLQSILLFRELQFPLKEIKTIIERPDFDRRQALTQQIALLELRKKRLGELISFAREMLKTGGNPMNFSVFDKTELEQYTAEAKRRWSGTAAYEEYERKTAGQTDSQRKAAADGLMEIFARLGEVKHLSPDAEEAQTLVRELREYISGHYYTCTPEILRGLGRMYVNDERMRKNIDRAGGAGTAEFAAGAIESFCKQDLNL